MERAFPGVSKPQRLRALGYLRRACRRRGGEVAVHFKKLSKRQVAVCHVPVDEDRSQRRRRAKERGRTWVDGGSGHSLLGEAE
mmetsp:Transcript_42093/g.132995  ORF Transcript_42093/g.132995 Transcript_42093/m.132995 type:complete len:83 (-) Transcript_42093:144-392(-)